VRLVIDTNVIVSGLYSLDSPPGRLLEAASERRIDLCAPENVRVELDRVLRRVLDYGDREVAATLLSRMAVPVVYYLIARRGRDDALRLEGLAPALSD